MTKFSSISEQISALESNLEFKEQELKFLEKAIDKFLKSLFGMDRKSIDSLIRTSHENVTYTVENPTGVEEKISE